jgi:hypothetical protein
MILRFSIHKTRPLRCAFVNGGGALVVDFSFAGSALAGRALVREAPGPAGVDPGRVAVTVDSNGQPGQPVRQQENVMKPSTEQCPVRASRAIDASTWKRFAQSSADVVETVPQRSTPWRR